MRTFCLVMIVGLAVSAMFLLWCAPDINRIQANIQAYSTRQLLPELPPNTKQGLGK